MNGNHTEEVLCFVEHLRAEHREIHTVLRDIEQIVRTKPGEAVEALVALRERLCRHFAEEEEGGCMEEAVSRMPSLADTVDNLEGEHHPLLIRLDALIETARRPPEAQTPPLAEGFAAFARALHAHEAAENRVLEKGLNINLEDGN